MNQWSETVGKVRHRVERVAEKDLMGLASLLDYSLTDASGEFCLPWPDDAMPPFAHWLNGNVHAPQSALGEDGHPAKGSFLPDMSFPRRMWASSRVSLLQDYSVGQALDHRESIIAVEAKSGRSGEMIFVELLHEYLFEGCLILREEQDIVYRAAAGAPTPRAKPLAEAEILAGHDYDWFVVVHPDPVLLFRYSAVTYNGHRIHYDRDYVTQVERYPGLVVHGPLIATLLIDLYQRNNPEGQVSEFVFKSLGPLFDLDPFYLLGKQCASGANLSAVNCEGEIAMQMKLSIQ